jgi:predicted anti-sigma-YlaC factor YlaD
MNACPFEAQVAAAARHGQAFGALEPHLAACESCRTLASVASLIAVDARRAVSVAPVPTSGVVWWRIQQRARREAMQAASRAVTLVQAVSVGAGVVVAAGIVRAMSSLAPDGNTAGAIGWIRSALPTAAELARFGTSVPVLLAAASCLAIAPVAVWLAFARD